MDKTIFEDKRKSYIEIGEIYFWTATINNWNKLLSEDEYKEIIIGSLDYLSKKGKCDIYAFVVMPNHIHLIWRILEPNNKESSQGSFMKFTAHEFKKKLRMTKNILLPKFKVNASNKSYEFWQRDPLAIRLFDKKIAIQKLDYIHNNPLAEHWQLAKEPSEYKYSSAKFYEQNKKNFSFLKNLLDEF